MAVDGSLNFNTKIDQSGFEKGTRTISSGINKLKGSLKSLAKTAAASMPFAKTGSIQKNIGGLTSSLKGLAGVAAAAFSVKQILDFAKASKEAYNTQIEQETKLTTIMKQRMGATDAQIDSVKQLAAEQQKLGVIGDEVQLAGAQQVATFLQESDSINALLPAMNNLLAQQNGLNATTSDAVNIGNMMGKVLQGQTSALKRVGISFSDAEEQVLKYGSESERAAMLAQVITNNVGHMNQALAQTDAGKQKQLANTMGDVKEQFGQTVMQIESTFLPLLSRLASGLSTVATMAQLVGTAIRDAFGVESADNSATVAAATAASTAAAAESYEDIEDSAEQTQKAQENNLASFDKVIKIGKQEQGTAGGATAAGGASGTVGTKAMTQTTKKARTWADDLKESLEKGDWDGIGKRISEKINKAVAKINWKGAGNKLGQGITNIFTFAYAFLKNTKWVSIGSGFAEFLNGAIQKTSFDKVGRTFAAKTNAFIGLAWGFVKDFDFVGAGLGFADLINGWVDEFDAGQLAQAISKAAKGVLDFISTSLKEIKWEKIGWKISDFINNIDWRGILTSLFKVIGNLIKAMPQLLKGIITNLDFENASALFALLFAPKMAKRLLSSFKTDAGVKGTLTDAGKSAGNTVGSGFEGTAAATGTGFANKLASGLSAATSVISAAIAGWQIGSTIYTLAEPYINKLTDKIQDLLHKGEEIQATADALESQNTLKYMNKFKEVGIDWIKRSDIENGTQAYFKALKIYSLLNQYPQLATAGYTAKRISNDVALYNDLLAGKLPKSVSSSSSAYIPTTSERIQESKISAEIEKLKKQYTNVPSDVLRKMARANLGLPTLAKGTVVPANYGNFAAILGDNKKEPEVVSPLSTMKQAVLEALAMQGKQKQPVTINISLDTRNGKRLLTKEVIDDINDIIDTTGKVPINI